MAASRCEAWNPVSTPISTYQYKPVHTSTYWFQVVQEHTSTYQYIPVYSSTYQSILVCTSMYQYIQVYTGMYRYVLVHPCLWKPYYEVANALVQGSTDHSIKCHAIVHTDRYRLIPTCTDKRQVYRILREMALYWPVLMYILVYTCFWAVHVSTRPFPLESYTPDASRYRSVLVSICQYIL
jgi:hypothetical protein